MSFYRLCLIMDALFEGGRMFVGATSVAYLSSTGMTLAQIASIKSVQAGTILAGEYPTGLIADTIGHRYSLLLSVMSAMIGFAAYFFGGSFLGFCLAEFFTALSLCFWSGAFEAFSIEICKMEKDAPLISRFFHQNQALNSAMVLICGLLGGWIGGIGLRWPYMAALASFVGVGSLLLTLPPSFHHTEKHGFTLMQNLKNSISEGMLHPALFPFFAALIAIQFVTQPILHFWQPLFQQLNPQMSSVGLGYIFAAYCGVNTVFGYVFSHIRSPRARNMYASIGLFLLFSLCYFALGMTSSFTWAVVLFCLLQGFLALTRTTLNVRINEIISSKSRASVLSSLSLLSRVGMITGLSLIGSVSNSDAQRLFHDFSLWSLSILTLLLIGIISLKFQKRGA